MCTCGVHVPCTIHGIKNSSHKRRVQNIVWALVNAHAVRIHVGVRSANLLGGMGWEAEAEAQKITDLSTRLYRFTSDPQKKKNISNSQAKAINIQ